MTISIGICILFFSSQKILAICENDVGVISNADKLQKHTHKIKGLAPMMGKVHLGEISGSLDSLLKTSLIGC